MSLLCLFFVAFLSVLGVTDLVKIILKKLFFPNKKMPIKEVKIPIYGHCENIEFIIRKIIFKYTWLGEYRNLKITIVNNGADSEMLEICRHLAQSNPGVSIS